MAIRLLAVRRAERNTIVQSDGAWGFGLLPIATATQRYEQYLSNLKQIHVGESV
jgi:hypothetical protein